MRVESDDHLVRYLLGDLPHDEAERLDERSVTDDEFALRLRMLENDLVDRYARGERFDAALERFDRAYRGSAYLRNKVRFAQALQALRTQAAPRPTRARPVTATGRLAWWSLAAAAVLVIAAAGYIGIRSDRLRDELVQVDARRAAAERQASDLQQELERTRARSAVQLPPVTATFLLTPPRRGLRNDMTTASLPRGTEQVILRTQVETDEYSTFWGALRDPSKGRVVWRSGDVPAEPSATDRVVTFTVPASVFSGERYTLELSGTVPGGSAELVGHYPIRVVLE